MAMPILRRPIRGGIPRLMERIAFRVEVGQDAQR
jgi:hypothetical protein